ncbi:MAG: efflux RND transporter periplasmic adaptor subunit [Deltaproteobacteria bacterium]|nr:efflux RND transporter periplasmic adaptor subunit [Myxococcales bacterium]MDP3218812.1 efflux RND transporter periplasmic adaptor subunit [Deltaproteobacteria bacterium]
MTRLGSWLFCAIFPTLAACQGAQAPAAAAAPEEAETPREVRLTPEAMRLAGIRAGRVERRALGGGVAVPAEVQFEPSSTAQVGPLVPGRITRVAVRLGDRVVRNQLLGIVASSDVSTARARLGQARARLAAADATLRRQRLLSTEGIGAQRAVIEAEAQVGELRAEVEGTQRQLAVFGAGTAGELQLRSPIDGVVVAVQATLGETASADRAAFVVTDPTRVWVRGNVPELEIARVAVGSAAIVRLHAFPDLSLPGTIVYVAPALDEQSRSLPIRVSLATPDARLRSGLFGSVELVGGAADERVLVVPIDAVASVAGQTTVFVPAAGANTFRPQAVELGRRAGGYYELRGGLAEGAALAVSGAFTLKSALQSGELGEAD